MLAFVRRLFGSVTVTNVVIKECEIENLGRFGPNKYLTSLSREREAIAVSLIAVIICCFT